MKGTLTFFCIGLTTLLPGSCNAAGDRQSSKDSMRVPSALDTLPAVHPGIVDSTGKPRLRQ